MSSDIVRIPQQKRSAQKKQAIIQAGYTLFCQQGYYQTNTAQIAKAAGVSVGIVYSYFHDKKDILREDVLLYLSELELSLLPVLQSLTSAQGSAAFLEKLIDLVLESHTMQPAAHDQFMAMALLHQDIMTLFEQFQQKLLDLVVEQMVQAGYAKPLLSEKVRIAYGMIEQFCHWQLAYSTKSESLRTSKALIVSTIQKLLEAETSPSTEK